MRNKKEYNFIYRTNKFVLSDVLIDNLSDVLTVNKGPNGSIFKANLIYKVSRIKFVFEFFEQD